VKIKTLVGLASIGAASAVLSGYFLRRRPRRLRYAASGAAFLLPFGVHALAGSDKPLTTFLFITDTHGAAASNANLVRALLQEQDVDFIVHGGDIADTESLWQAWWDTPFARVIQRWPVYPTRGNHDPESGFRQHFPNRWPPYTLSREGVDIFFIPYAVTDSVVAWLDRATAASTAPFKILVTHRPVWPANSGGALSSQLAASLPRLDLILAGHNHVYWDTPGTPRQIIEISGPKMYACDAGTTGCVEGSAGYTRVEVYGDRLVVRRRPL
jgi:predicted phosphodiesterase